MTDGQPGTVFEFTVAGQLGPLFRSAFARERISAVESCTVIHVRVPADRDIDLVDLVGLFESAGIAVRDLFRVSRPARPGSVTPVPAEPRPLAAHSRRTMSPPTSTTTNELSGSDRTTSAPASTATGPTPGGNT